MGDEPESNELAFSVSLVAGKRGSHLTKSKTMGTDSNVFSSPRAVDWFECVLGKKFLYVLTLPLSWFLFSVWI